MAFSINVPVKVRYHKTCGAPLQMIALIADRGWLKEMGSFSGYAPEQMGLFDEKDKAPFTVHFWDACAQITRLATQIAMPPPTLNSLQLGFFRMSKGTEILCRILSQKPEDLRSIPASPMAHRDRHAEDVRVFILQHLDGDLSLNRIEAVMCRHRRALQRDFKEAFGLSIADCGLFKHDRFLYRISPQVRYYAS